MQDYIFVLGRCLKGMKDGCAVLLVLVVDLTVILLEQAVDNFEETLLAGYHQHSFPVLLWV